MRLYSSITLRGAFSRCLLLFGSDETLQGAYIFMAPLCRWRGQDSENSTDLARTMEPVSGRARFNLRLPGSTPLQADGINKKQEEDL